ncbi:MAG TPA: hypothetical protein VMO17_22440 [Terriglobia bacterium]|nr:hypothetical protein [Terriglobia bacterium]
MRVQGKSVLIGLAAAVFATACLGFGSWGIHKSSDRRTDVTFLKKTKFDNGSVLAAGTYDMEVPENSQTPEVMFKKDGKVMATVPAKMIAQSKKNDYTEIDAVTNGDTQMVTAIRPGGWEESLMFRKANH